MQKHVFRMSEDEIKDMDKQINTELPPPDIDVDDDDGGGMTEELMMMREVTMIGKKKVFKLINNGDKLCQYQI